MKYLVSLFFIAFASGIVGCQKTDSTPNAPLFSFSTNKDKKRQCFHKGKTSSSAFNSLTPQTRIFPFKTQSSTLGTFWKCLAR
jgi:hypothetical protein